MPLCKRSCLLATALTLVIAVGLPTAVPSLSAAESPDGEVGSSERASAAITLPDITLTDLDGQTHRLRGESAESVTIVVFLSTTCPIANAALNRLEELAIAVSTPTTTADTEPPLLDVRVLGVISEPSLTRAAATAHFQERPTSFPILFDASGLLRAVLAPTHVPEAFAFHARGVLAYRGAIDDAYGAVGRRRPRVTQRYLADAVVALRSGRQPDVPFVPPVGCLLEPPPRMEASKVTMPAISRRLCTPTVCPAIAPPAAVRFHSPRLTSLLRLPP